MSGSAMMQSAARKYPTHRDGSISSLPTRCEITESDMLFAPFRDQPGWLDCQHQQQEREHNNIYEARIEKLRGVAFNESDDQTRENGSFDVAEAANNDDCK